MPRPRYRACLQDGLKLDLNHLARNRFIVPGAQTGPTGICWPDNCGDVIAFGTIHADLSGERTGWFRFQMGSLDQTFMLVREPRRFGGGQWYFRCPRTYQRCSVVWKPPGANSFACRSAWKNAAAYRSQFQTREDRAHSMSHRLCARLGGPDWESGGFEDPPKPKGMRWKTYDRALDRIAHYEAIKDEGLLWATAKLMGLR